MQNPTFDNAGYPTEETLEAIANWPSEDMVSLFQFIKEAWKYDDMCWRQEGRTISASTVGWSGNEELISALRDNTIVWMICWQSSKRGGHYVFEIPEYQMKENKEAENAEQEGARANKRGRQ